MTWNVAHGRGPLLEAGQWNHAATGWTVDAWATEEGALAYACDMVRKGRGVHSVWESGEEEPKYRRDDILRLACAGLPAC